MMLDTYQESFEKVIDFLEKEIGTLRTGRATPSLVEGIKVEAYGMKQDLKAVASITIQDAKNIIVEPWDKSIVQDVDKAIRTSDLGINPVNDGSIIRLPLPELTQDRRKDLVKVLHNKLEQARISLRKVREDARNAIDKAEKSKEISEDDRYVLQEKIEEMVKEYNQKIRQMGEKKEEEVNTI